MAVAVLVLRKEEGRVLLVIVFCDTGPQSILESNIALSHLWNTAEAPL